MLKNYCRLSSICYCKKRFTNTFSIDLPLKYFAADLLIYIISYTYLSFCGDVGGDGILCFFLSFLKFLFLSIYFVHNNILFSRLYPCLDHITRVRTKNIFSFVHFVFCQSNFQSNTNTNTLHYVIFASRMGLFSISINRY